MQSFERMRKMLVGIGLYQLNGNSLIEAELYAYGVVLDQVHVQLEQLLKDGFIDEVESPKGEIFEDLFGFPTTPFPLDEDRKKQRLQKIEMMKQRLRIKNNHFSQKEVKSLLQTGGFEVEIGEDFANKKVKVKVTHDRQYCEDKQDKIEFIRQAIPCHSTVEVSF